MYDTSTKTTTYWTLSTILLIAYMMQSVDTYAVTEVFDMCRLQTTIRVLMQNI